MNKIEICQKVIDDKQYTYVKASRGKMMLDGLTATAIVKIYNAIKDPIQKENFLKADWEKIANFSIKRCGF